MVWQRDWVVDLQRSGRIGVVVDCGMLACVFCDELVLVLVLCFLLFVECSIYPYCRAAELLKDIEVLLMSQKTYLHQYNTSADNGRCRRAMTYRPYRTSSSILPKDLPKPITKFWHEEDSNPSSFITHSGSTSDSIRTG